MQKLTICRIFILLTALLFIQTAHLCADTEFESSPRKKGTAAKFRIAYLEGGSYQMYPAVLAGIAKGLEELDWIEPFTFPTSLDTGDSAAIWKWLAKNASSDYLEFVEDAYWSAAWDSDKRKKIKVDILRRFKEQNDIDLIIANGTWAGQDMANDEHSVAVVVCSTSDPVQAKIIMSEENSGHAHIHARVDPTRFQRQIGLFHDIIGFDKLGITYIDTVAGRSYAALDDIELMAGQLGFTIKRCLLPDKLEGQELTDLTAACHEELAAQVDAVYITIQTGVTLKGLPQLLAPLNEQKIPTFSQAGSREVEHGILLSISQANYRYVARFHAETIAKIFNGAQPGELGQVFEDPPKIAINIAEAEIIGFNPSVDILSAADEIYNEIKVAD